MGQACDWEPGGLGSPLARCYETGGPFFLSAPTFSAARGRPKAPSLAGPGLCPEWSEPGRGGWHLWGRPSPRHLWKARVPASPRGLALAPARYLQVPLRGQPDFASTAGDQEGQCQQQGLGPAPPTAPGRGARCAGRPAPGERWPRSVPTPWSLGGEAAGEEGWWPSGLAPGGSALHGAHQPHPGPCPGPSPKPPTLAPGPGSSGK